MMNQSSSQTAYSRIEKVKTNIWKPHSVIHTNTKHRHGKTHEILKMQ